MSLKNRSYFTKKQLMCIELLAQGTSNGVSIASEIGVNPNSIYRWKKDPKFMHAVVMRSRAILKEELPAVYKSLGKESKDGSAQHIKILLDHLETLEEAKAGGTTITFTWKGAELNNVTSEDESKDED